MLKVLLLQVTIETFYYIYQVAVFQEVAVAL